MFPKSTLILLVGSIFLSIVGHATIFPGFNVQTSPAIRVTFVTFGTSGTQTCDVTEDTLDNARLTYGHPLTFSDIDDKGLAHLEDGNITFACQFPGRDEACAAYCDNSVRTSPKMCTAASQSPSPPQGTPNPKMGRNALCKCLD